MDQDVPSPADAPTDPPTDPPAEAPAGPPAGNPPPDEVRERADGEAQASAAGTASEPTVDAATGSVTAPGTVLVADTAPRRSRGAVIAIWILGVVLVLALALVAWGTWQFLLAQDRISEQQDRIRQQQDEIDEQKELIEKKESFGAAMSSLMDTAAQFEGIPMGSLVPWEEYRSLAGRGWAHRWDAFKMGVDTERVDAARTELEAVWTAAQAEAASNATGTAYETTIDQLGRGFVRSVVDDEYCSTGDDGILGCVFEGDPYLVHFEASGNAEPFMTDELRTGVAYHEFAHVLQFTNPDATAATLPAFGGDHEFMADCYALTFLEGWKLDHRVWTSSYEYWDVNVGYGRTCDPTQQQAIRDWYAQLGVRRETLSS